MDLKLPTYDSKIFSTQKEEEDLYKIFQSPPNITAEQMMKESAAILELDWVQEKLKKRWEELPKKDFKVFKFL